MKSIISHLTIPLCFSLTLCFFMACSSDSPAPANKPAEPISEVEEPTQPSEDTTAAVIDADTSTQAAPRENIKVDPIDTRLPTRDKQDNVVRYTLMHGRNSKYTASRTSGNYDGPGGYGKAFKKFPFGNWNQQWVAVANIETPVN